jgi:small-conductance mechanosensitive channel
MLSNDMVILPNSKLTQSVLTNYYLPDPRRGTSVTMSLPPTVDPAQIERLLLDEAAQAVGHIPGLLAEPAPSVRLMQTPGVPTLDFTLNCHVREFTDQYLVQHELRKRILMRFRKEGLQLAYPYYALPPGVEPRRPPS